MKWSVNELLSILDGSEESQMIWLATLNIIRNSEGEKGQVVLDESLAETAFRLRGTTFLEFNYPKAIQIVHEYVDHGGNRMYNPTLVGALSWFCFLAQPIHWIVAALIAKEMVADTDEKVEAMRLPIEGVRTDRVHEVRYAIGQDDGEDGYGMWDGPSPSLADMLSIIGRDNNSVIIRYNEDGTDKVIYKWVCEEWMKVISEIDG